MGRYSKISLLGFGHLLVDFCSIYLIYSMTSNSVILIAMYFIIYNGIAFASQPVFGFIADKYNLYRLYIILGLLLALIAVMMPVNHIIFIVFATIGNALYHVGGGVVSIRLFPGKAAPAGIFVAPGAIGVFLGVFVASEGNISKLFIIVPTIIMLVILYIVFGVKKESQIKHQVPSELGLLTFLILVVVLIRGMIGFAISFPWKDGNLLSFALVLGVFLGKFFGGILGDRFGYRTIGIGGLLLSVPFLLFGSIPMVGIIGAVLFNFTMAITLFLIISMFGKYQGFAFGLTTLALFVSYLTSALGLYTNSLIISNILLVILPIIAAILLNIVITKFYKYREEVR